MRALRSIGMVMLAGGCGMAVLAQAPAPNPGATVKVELKTKLDTKKSTVGEAIKAEIKQEIKKGPMVLLPKGGYLIGQVTEVAASEHGSPGKIGLLFDEVTDKKGNVLRHIRAAIVHIAAGSTDYSQISVPSEMGGSGMPVAQAGLGGALTSADRSSNGQPLAFALMETFNGSGTDLGGVIETQNGNFNLDQGTQVQVQILQSGN
ncbi:MAG: hypothetical protein ACRD1C_06520 [Terriglobales bacterium]